jgi:DNA-binding transcriptional ArsR family regulator
MFPATTGCERFPPADSNFDRSTEDHLTMGTRAERSAPTGDPFEALGDANRRSIVELLGAGERSVRELSDELPISRPAVSRHLRLLKDAGLVVEEARGTRRIYRLHDEGVAAVEAYLRQVWGDAAVRFRLLAENTEPLDQAPARGRRSQRP